MRRRYRVPKTLSIFLLVLLLVLAAYLHFGLLPGELKSYAVEKIEALTPFKVSFDKILYLPFEGLSLRNAKIMEKSGETIFTARKLAVNVKWLPFFREKKIIVSNILLDTPFYDATLEPKPKKPKTPTLKTKISGEIEVPVVSDEKRLGLKSIEEGPEAFLPENVYIEGIQIVNGAVTIRKNKSSPLIEEIRSINIRMGFKKPPRLTFDGSVKLGPKEFARISLKGQWDLNRANYEFYFKTDSDLVPAWLLLYQKNRFVVFQRGAFVLDAHLLSINEQKATFHAKANLKNATLLINKATYEGAMGLDAYGIFDFGKKTFDKYRGTLELYGVNVSNLSKNIRRLENIDAKVDFRPDLLKIEKVSGRYEKIFFDADGSIRSFKELYLNATIRTNAGISEILTLLPADQKKILQDFTLEGACHAVTTITGSLKKTADLQTDYKLLLENGSVKNAQRKINLSNISSVIFADSQGFRIKNCRFAAQEKYYLLDAFIPKKPDTPGDLNLSSKELTLLASYFLEKDGLKIQKASANYLGIPATFAGRMKDLQKPRLDITGETEIDLEKVIPNFSAKTPWLKSAGLKGLVKGLFTLNGVWNDPLNWDFKMDAKANPLYVKQKVRLDKFDAQIRMKNKVINVPYMHATPYGGTLGLAGTFALSRPGAFFSAKIYGNNLAVGPLLKDLDVKQEIYGAAVFQIAMNGFLKSPQTLIGKGSVDIHDGRLWETDLFKQMGNLPLVRVEGLDRVTFHSATSTFDIRDKKIWTDNLKLFSDTVDLSMEGTIGFDQNLDLLMDIRYSPDVFRGAQDVGGIVPMVIGQAENHISEYKIHGALKEPKFDKVVG